MKMIFFKSLLIAVAMSSQSVHARPKFVPEIAVHDNVATPRVESLTDNDEVEFPVRLPSTRGAILHNPLPTYHFRSGDSVWGLGWQSQLEIEFRFGRYTSPWGKLQESNVADTYYPVGLPLDIRIVKEGNDFKAYHPDGRLFTFHKSSEFEWHLVDVVDPIGQRTSFIYDENNCLKNVKYGGVRRPQYELEFICDTRIRELRINHWDGKQFKTVRTVHLKHEHAHLVSVDSVRYEYGALSTNPYAQLISNLSLRETFVDFNLDGIPEVDSVSSAKHRRLLFRPAGFDDALHELRLLNKRSPNGTKTDIVVYDLSGHEIKRDEVFQPLGLGFSFRDSTHLVDLNGDFKPDIIRVGHKRYVYVLNKSSKGHVEWAQPVTLELEMAKSDFVSHYAFADINGDGFVDLVGQARGWIYVWYGNHEWRLSKTPKRILYPSSSIAHPQWIDVNRDRKMDIVVHDGARVSLWVNRGDYFERAMISGLDNLSIASVRVMNLVGNGNDQLTVYDAQRGLICLNLNQAGTGLLTKMDNGEGEVHEWGYGWSKPTPGVPAFIVVPASKTRHIKERGPSTKFFEFQNPVVNLHDMSFLGFSQININDAVTRAVTQFALSASLPLKVSRVEKIDIRRSDIADVQQFSYVDDMLDGISFQRLAQEVQLYIQKGFEVLRRSMEFPQYNRLCPSKTIESLPQGRRVQDLSYFDNRACLDYQEVTAYNEMGLPTKMRHTEIAYENGKVKSVAVKGEGTWQVEYDPEWEIVRSVIHPNGDVESIVDFDPIADKVSVKKNHTEVSHRHERYTMRDLATGTEIEKLDKNSPVISETEISPLWGMLSRRAHVNEKYQNTVMRHFDISSGELVTTTVENNQFVTNSSRTHYVDELKRRYEYQYDVLNRLRQIKLPNGDTHKIDFDDLGQKTRISRSGVGDIFYEYSKSIQQDKNVDKHFEYDDRGQIKSVQIAEQIFAIKRNKWQQITHISLPDGDELQIDYDPITGGRRGHHTRSAFYAWQLNDRGLIKTREAFAASHWQVEEHTYLDDKTLPLPSQVQESEQLLDVCMKPLLSEGVVYEKLRIEDIDVGLLIDGKFQFVLFDQVGSVISDGNFFSMPTPFGERDTCYARGRYFDFAGMGRDDDTGLIRMGERDYNPKTGMFTSPDRFFLENPEECIRSPQECDLYSYAKNNPLLYVDESGTFAHILLNVGFIGWSAIEFYRDPSWLNGASLLGSAVPFLGPGLKAASSVNAAQLRIQLMAKEIAAGHALEKHVVMQGEFPGWIRTRFQFEKHIENVLRHPTEMKELSRGRIGFWDEASSMVVIRDPSKLDGGTAFQPILKKTYYDFKLQ